MGKHFDNLVDIVKKEGMEDIKMLIKNAKLFEFPFPSNTVRKMAEMSIPDFVSYMNDYFEASAQSGIHMFMPFKTMAIEDKESVVILRNIKDSRYEFLSTNKGAGDTPSITKGEIKMDSSMNPAGEIYLDATIREYITEDSIPNIKDFYDAVTSDAGQAVVSFINELVYIMDPSRFILSKESNASIKQRQKKKDAKPRKTVMRPHFIFVEKEDMKRFLSEESKEPFTAHPVAGHWRKLKSDRYVNMKDQAVLVRQYWKGEGSIIGRNGWNYQVYLKTGNPLKLTKYTPAKNGKLPKK